MGWWAGWNASGGGDFKPNITYITNSKGYHFPVTEQGLQSAIYDLNSTNGGSVELPVCNISLSNRSTGGKAPIKLTNNVWLKGQGKKSILYLTDRVNKSIITNFDTTNGNKNIKVSDLRVEGNGLHQDEYWHFNANKYTYAYGIIFRQVTGGTVESVVSNNTQATGIYFRWGTNNTIINCVASNNALRYKISGNGYDNWFGKGIWLDGSNYSLISGCIVDRAYGTGITVENEDASQTNEATWQHNVVVTGCTVFRVNYGFYTEWSKDIVFEGCVADSCNFTDVYDGAAGFRCGQTSQRVTYTGCTARNCGVAGSDANCGYSNVGKFTKYVGCSSFNSYNGFESYGQNVSYEACSSHRDVGSGFKTEGNTTYSNCRVDGSGEYGISIYGASCFLAKVFGCVFSDTGDRAVIVSVASNVSIIGNEFIKCVGDAVRIESVNAKGFTVNNNRFLNCIGHDISFAPTSGVITNSTVSNNYLFGGGQWKYAISLSSCRDFLVSNNFITSPTLYSADYPEYAIAETGTSNNNVYIGNKIVGVYDTPYIIIVGDRSYIRDNAGFKTESSGTCTIAADGASVRINHNLSNRPNTITVAPLGNLTCTNGRYGYNFTYSTTQITIYVPGKLVGACKFYWTCSNITGGARKPS
jgi:parallel beta-helix repeat protein